MNEEALTDFIQLFMNTKFHNKNYDKFEYTANFVKNLREKMNINKQI
jgi:hypothetical protein